MSEIKSIKAKRIGDLQRVTNTKRKFAAAEEYSHLRVQLPDGEEVHLLLTDNELKRALDRSKKNPEDLPKVSWIRDILD